MADDDVATTADQFDKLATAPGHLVIAFNDLEVALACALMYLLKQDEEMGAAFERLEKAAVIRVIHQEPAFSELFIAHLLGRTIRVEADLVDQLIN